MFYKISPWLLFSFFIAVLVTIPLAVIFINSFNVNLLIWDHIYKHLFGSYVLNSIFLVLGVSLVTMFMGVSAAWFTSFYSIPFKKIISILLVIPIAIPPYAVAYCYADLTDSGGLVHNFFYYVGIEQYFYLIPSVRSLFGSVFVLSLTLFPYVYLITKYSFNNNAIKIMESAANLGANRIKLLFKFALPISRPALVAGITLVVMESLADFGVVHFLGIDSLSVGIYKAWFGLDDISSSARLASVLLIFSLSAILIERFLRKNKKENYVSYGKNTNTNLIFKAKLFFPLFVLITILLLSLFVPIFWLVLNVLKNDLSNIVYIAPAILNSFKLAFFGGLSIVMIATLITFTKRIYKVRSLSFLLNFAKIGYASPGIVIAIGVIAPVLYLDKKANYFFGTIGIDTGLVLTNSIFILLFAYLIRFLSVAFNPVEAAIDKISNKIDYSAFNLGASNKVLFFKVHLPMIFVSCCVGFLLVFIDILKELPLTLILRPMNFNTLSIYTFEYASSEQLVLAALPALLITLIGIIPLIFIHYILNSTEENKV